MAAIQPGTGGTFKTSTCEGRLIETICFLQSLEVIPAKNLTGRNAVNGSFDIEDLTFSGTFSLPITQAILPTGGLSIVAQTYIQDNSFNPGTATPTFVSTTIEAYLLEVLSYMQSLESTPGSNPNNRNFITGQLNTDTNLYVGGFNIPVALALNAAGKAEFSAVEYLV